MFLGIKVLKILQNFMIIILKGSEGLQLCQVY